MRVGTDRFICAREYVAEFTRIRWVSHIMVHPVAMEMEVFARYAIFEQILTYQ